MSIQNKFVRFPNLSRKAFKESLTQYHDVIDKKIAWLESYGEIYDLPVTLYRKNLKDLKAVQKAIQVLLNTKH